MNVVHRVATIFRCGVLGGLTGASCGVVTCIKYSNPNLFLIKSMMWAGVAGGALFGIQHEFDDFADECSKAIGGAFGMAQHYWYAIPSGNPMFADFDGSYRQTNLPSQRFELRCVSRDE